jgi:hypothetical protein
VSQAAYWVRANFKEPENDLELFAFEPHSKKIVADTLEQAEAIVVDLKAVHGELVETKIFKRR